MRCVSFCTAVSYRLDALSEHFRRKRYLFKLSKTVLYVTKASSDWHIYFFNHGCFVAWGLKKSQEAYYLIGRKFGGGGLLRGGRVGAGVLETSIK